MENGRRETSARPFFSASRIEYIEYDLSPTERDVQLLKLSSVATAESSRAVGTNELFGRMRQPARAAPGPPGRLTCARNGLDVPRRTTRVRGRLVRAWSGRGPGGHGPQRGGQVDAAGDPRKRAQGRRGRHPPRRSRRADTPRVPAPGRPPRRAQERADGPRESRLRTGSSRRRGAIARGG